jgi:hypothetical protein
MLFELVSDDKNFKQPYLDNNAMQAIISSIDEQTQNDEHALVYLAKNWGNPTAEFDQTSDEPEHSLLPDIGFWYQYLLLSENAFNLLKSSLRTYCELLPVDTEFGRYYLINIIQENHANNSWITSDLITFSCHEQSLSHQALYKKNINGLDTYFCTREFKTLIEENNFVGLKFIELSN